PMSLPPALSADHTQLTFNWQVSQTILPDAYELQIRKDAGDWETIADTITQTAYTMDIDTTVQMYYARVRSKINNKWASESWSNTVFFNTEVLPVLETSKSNIHIFPNPFSEKLKIDLHQPADIKVYNQNGQTMLQQALTGKNELSTTSWPSGLYFVKITTLESTQVFKLLKP
ncbi:MAG TPA: T9SS type A sorting domain-containing protein, partial [Saprospiraceae bacterium]|nr:T9SS type A sorting domain-containing protein [Saprospiraceae bacterium]